MAGEQGIVIDLGQESFEAKLMLIIGLGMMVLGEEIWRREGSPATGMIMILFALCALAVLALGVGGVTLYLKAPRRIIVYPGRLCIRTRGRTREFSASAHTFRLQSIPIAVPEVLTASHMHRLVITDANGRKAARLAIDAYKNQLLEAFALNGIPLEER